jgi:2-oxo-4-hydroxy-4-carboxy-5-ureidoimidazoline decarboxylase
MSGLLAQWNRLPLEDAVKAILPCCGSNAWARGLAARRPFADVTTLLAASDETWSNLTAADWVEAFQSHPRIGESLGAEPESDQSGSSQSGSSQSKIWAAQEQQKVAAAGDAARIALAEANHEYERRFHHIFIVCATGKSAPEILEILRRRMQNDEPTELREAAEQQRQIIHIRVKKWLSE